MGESLNLELAEKWNNTGTQINTDRKKTRKA
jgi:hypothetical protein